MNRPEPDWYADLKGEPLRVRMFTPELAVRIRMAAGRHAQAKAAASLRAMYIGAAACCLAAILLFAARQDLLTLPGPAIGGSSGEMDDRVSGAGAGHGGADGSEAVTDVLDVVVKDGYVAGSRIDDTDTDVVEPVEPVEAAQSEGWIQYPEWSPWPILAVAEPTLDEWQLLIDAIDPNRQYVVLFGESVDDGRRLVVAREFISSGDTLRGHVKVYLMERKQDGWQWAAAVEFGPDDLRKAEHRVYAGWAGFGPQERGIEIFQGFVLDPDIARIRVAGQQGDVYEAKLFPEAEGVTTWYARTPEQPYHGDYVVEGLDAEGNVVYSKPLKEHGLHAGQKIEPDAEVQP